MKLALHILWAIASVIVIGYSFLYLMLASEFGNKQDFIVPIIFLTIGIASAVASIYLYVR